MVVGKKAHLRLPSMVQKRCMLKLSNVDENLEEKKNNLDNSKGKRKIDDSTYISRNYYILLSFQNLMFKSRLTLFQIKTATLHIQEWRDCCTKQ